MSLANVTKAIFPVAGLGTRFLPATKANPKEMLPIVDKPLIQYAVEEAIAAGITELIFVTSSSKRAIEDHFDSNFELEVTLEASGKLELLSIVRNIVPSNVSCAYIRQKAPLGLGHAVWCAKQLVGDEPVAVLLADDLIDGHGTSCMQQMVAQFTETQQSIVAVQTIPQSETRRYGMVGVQDPDGALMQVDRIVEKPEASDAPSNLGVVGRYILTPRIFSLLETTKRGSGGEIQLTDAISELLSSEDVYAYRFAGTRYDCGSKLGYLQATVAYALKHPDLHDAFRDHLSEIIA